MDEKTKGKIEKIIEVCAYFYNVTIEEVLQPSRTFKANKREKVLARQSAMVFMLEILHIEKKQAGIVIGGRDHSTVIHAEKAISDLIDTDKGFSENFKILRREVIWHLRRKKTIIKPIDVFKKHGYMFT